MFAGRLYIDHPDKKSIISKYAGDPASPMQTPTLHPTCIEAARKLKKEAEFVSGGVLSVKYLPLPSLIQRGTAPVAGIRLPQSPRSGRLAASITK
jgi:hypothetical protein